MSDILKQAKKDKLLEIIAGEQLEEKFQGQVRGVLTHQLPHQYHWMIASISKCYTNVNVNPADITDVLENAVVHFSIPGFKSIKIKIKTRLPQYHPRFNVDNYTLTYMYKETLIGGLIERWVDVNNIWDAIIGASPS